MLGKTGKVIYIYLLIYITSVVFMLASIF